MQVGNFKPAILGNFTPPFLRKNKPPFTLLSRLLEKAMNDEMTIASISDKLSELKALPVKVSGGIITIRTESENARRVLERMNIPYPGRVLESLIT